MIEACGLDHGPMRENFVRVEITPTDDDLTVPLDEWIYCVDQDYLPDWYVEEVDKKRCFDALKTWAIKHILIGKSIEKLTAEDEPVILINSTIKVLDGGTVQKVWGGGTVQHQRGGIVIYSNGKISVCDKNFYHLVYAQDKNSKEQ